MRERSWWSASHGTRNWKVAEVKEAKEVEEVKEVKDPREAAWGGCEKGGFCERNMAKDSMGINCC